MPVIEDPEHSTHHRHCPLRLHNLPQFYSSMLLMVVLCKIRATARNLGRAERRVIGCHEADRFHLAEGKRKMPYLEAKM